MNWRLYLFSLIGLVFAVALLLFGGDKLPEFARGIGKVMREVKKAASGVEDEFRRAMDEDERKRLHSIATAPGGGIGARETGGQRIATPHVYGIKNHRSQRCASIHRTIKPYADRRSPNCIDH